MKRFLEIFLLFLVKVSLRLLNVPLLYRCLLSISKPSLNPACNRTTFLSISSQFYHGFTRVVVPVCNPLWTNKICVYIYEVKCSKFYQEIMFACVKNISVILRIQGMKIEDEEMERAPRIETPAVISTSCHRSGEHDSVVTRIPSTLSVAAVDVVVACQPSPSHSILTLTPGRTRNIDQDMEALRLSRQDNPFLQVLASRESLVESIEESESDDAILMSQELGDADPLTLAQVHEHLVRSPPPASWPHTPVFHFPHQNNLGKSDASPHFTHYHKSPSKAPIHRGMEKELSKSEPSNDIRDTPIRFHY
ncbi:uncharacterized protein LOC107263056 isoform X2 [Cephus cinctus]|uniref:Uncharacterized protein LOC107263056 isoform X2 n=1 Tax=Cephus cinctus TaxID=211228 RepID=A0AAJ7R8D8_CEPCN|nr:uncharacterized protein LOC107263056 isoform X2 [Cephus cinctus]